MEKELFRYTTVTIAFDWMHEEDQGNGCVHTFIDVASAKEWIANQKGVVWYSIEERIAHECNGNNKGKLWYGMNYHEYKNLREI